jgi:hypothetical protein
MPARPHAPRDNNPANPGAPANVPGAAAPANGPALQVPSETVAPPQAQPPVPAQPGATAANIGTPS